VVWWRQNERHPETYLLHAPALAAGRVYGVPGGGIMNGLQRGIANGLPIALLLWIILCFIGTVVLK
jgi:hypothetical protein